MQKYFISSLLAALLITVAFVNTPSAHAQQHISTSVPISFSQFVPCANNGQGEVVTVSGTEHDLFLVLVSNAGPFIEKFQFNGQDVSGVGQTTGDRYQAPGVTQDTATAQTAKLGQEITFVNNLPLIGQGPGNNLLFHDNTHITVNPDGTVTTSHDNFGLECK